MISTLKAKFNTVQLPKSFLAVNVSDKHEEEAEMQRRASYLQSEAAKKKHGSGYGDLQDMNAEDGPGGPQAGDALVRDNGDNGDNAQPEMGAAGSSPSKQEVNGVQPQFLSTGEEADAEDTAAGFERELDAWEV